MMVQGDDNIMRHSGDKILFSDSFLKLGFETVSMYREHLYESEFCSAIPVRSDSGVVFVPKIGRVLAKFGYFINPPLNIHPYSLLKGSVLGLSFLSTIPVFLGFFSGVLDKVAIFPAFFVHQFIVMSYVKFQANEDTRFDILSRYGFDVEMYETVCSALKLGNMDHPYVKCLFDRDTDGKKLIYE